MNLNIKLSITFVFMTLLYSNEITNLNLKGEKIYHKKGYTEALKYFLSANNTQKYNYRTLGNLVITYIKLKKYKIAKKYVNTQIKHATNDKEKGSAYFNKGLIYEKQNKITLAVLNYKKSINLRPNKYVSKKIFRLINPKTHDWLLEFNNHRGNRVVIDSRFNKLLSDIVPVYKNNLLGEVVLLKNNVISVLGGISEAIIFSNDIVYFSACRYQSCSEKGFLWYDTGKNKGIVAIIHYIYNDKIDLGNPSLFITTKNYLKNEIPDLFNTHLNLWLKANELNIKIVRYYCKGNVLIDLSKKH